MNGTIPATSTDISLAVNARLLEDPRSRNRATKRVLSIAQEVVKTAARDFLQST